MPPPAPPAAVRRMFSDIAPTYDFLNHLLSLSVDRLWRRTVARVLLPRLAGGGGGGASRRDACTTRESRRDARATMESRRDACTTMESRRDACTTMESRRDARTTRESRRDARATRGSRRDACTTMGEGLRALDVCAGTGDLTLALARRAGPGARIVAVDFSEAMLRLARKKFRRAGFSPAARHAALAPAARRAAHLPAGASRGSMPDAPRLDAVQGDALHLPAGDAAVDLVTMAFGLRNLADPVAGLREAARVLRPGGRVAVLEFSMPRSRWVAPLYRFYLGRILPWVGRLLTRTSAYTYLADTVAVFPSAEVVLGWMAEAGLHASTARPLTGGIATLYTAEGKRTKDEG